LSRAGSGAWVVFANGAVRTYGAAPRLAAVAPLTRAVPVVAATGW
jgi:hypothetical protein